LPLQKIRQEAVAASVSNSAAMEERLQSMEKTMADEHLEQMTGIARQNRMILITAWSFALVSVLVLLLGSFFQWAAVNRLAATASLISHSAPASGPGEALLAPGHALEQSSLRFLGLMDRLEQRLHDLETSVKSPKTLTEGGSNGSTIEPVETPPPAAPDKMATLSLLISKSQTLLKLDKAEAALGCLEEALTLDPANPDALVKKGAALERLRRLPEAIECYDRAIARDSSMTMAYLYKGSLFNRMER
jgi:tetratricopeptide (TPR) repeat protein